MRFATRGTDRERIPVTRLLSRSGKRDRDGPRSRGAKVSRGIDRIAHAIGQGKHRTLKQECGETELPLRSCLGGCCTMGTGNGRKRYRGECAIRRTILRNGVEDEPNREDDRQHSPLPCLGIKESSAGPRDRAILYGRGGAQAVSRIVVGFRAVAKVSMPAEQVQNRSRA